MSSQSPAPQPPSPWSGSSMTFRQRFGYYFIGLAVSCVLMGLYFSYMYKVRSEARAEKIRRMEGMPLPQPGVPLKRD